MAPLELRKAQRSKAYLKLGMAAPSGGGKTLGSLLIAYGLMKGKYPDKSDDFRWSKIALVDSENGSGELYVGATYDGVKIGRYNVITLESPFTAEKYTEAIKLCADSGMEVVILDSTTQLWAGPGGLLEEQGNYAKRTGNSYTAWRDVTPKYKAFVDAIHQTPIHVIATARSKQEYSVEKGSDGKLTVQKLGLEPEQRKGFEYEFTTFFDISADHTAFGSKDRTSLFDQQFFKITPDVGVKLMKWLSEGTEEAPEVVAVSAPEPADPKEALNNLKATLREKFRSLGGSKNEDLMSIIKKYVPNGNINLIDDTDKLVNLNNEIDDYLSIKDNLEEPELETENN